MKKRAGHGGRQFNDEASKLLREFNEARRNGSDFPTIWHDILKKNLLVAGPPIQHIDESGPRSGDSAHYQTANRLRRAGVFDPVA